MEKTENIITNKNKMINGSVNNQQKKSDIILNYKKNS